LAVPELVGHSVLNSKRPKIADQENNLLVEAPLSSAILEINTSVNEDSQAPLRGIKNKKPKSY
jgi:hypothetical protein